MSQTLEERVALLEAVVKNLLTKRDGDEGWQKTSDAARTLDYGPQSLRLWVNEPYKSPYFVEGVHYKRHKGGYKFNIVECKKAIDNHTQRI
ncbi:MAG: hypothetical protein AAGG02_12540 [Cyanobacteria bacterium P01_H01_bin.15]